MLHIVTDPKENRPHTERLSQTFGAYEWFYFDAQSTDSMWTLVVIWFLGNPFSEYSRKISLRQSASPVEHNGLYFALHKHGKLYAYHFSRFPADRISIGEDPLDLTFGQSTLKKSLSGDYFLNLKDTNANGRTLRASLQFRPVFLCARPEEASIPSHKASKHNWLPAAPMCKAIGTIELAEQHNYGKEVISFVGEGYHDQNWGQLPFSPIQDWYWARINFPGNECVILYHLTGEGGTAQQSLLRLDGLGRIHHMDGARILRSKSASILSRNLPKTATAASTELTLEINRGRLLDTSPFYTRGRVDATLVDLATGETKIGLGMAEVFRPDVLTHWLTVSAMKARIVER